MFRSHLSSHLYFIDLKTINHTKSSRPNSCINKRCQCNTKKTFYNRLLTCSYWRRVNKMRSIFLLRICILVNDFNNILDIALQLGADFINDFQRNRFVLTQLCQSCITNSHQISEFNLSHITLDELVPQGLVRNRHGNPSFNKSIVYCKSKNVKDYAIKVRVRVNISESKEIRC